MYAEWFYRCMCKLVKRHRDNLKSHGTVTTRVADVVWRKGMRNGAPLRTEKRSTRRCRYYDVWMYRTTGCLFHARISSLANKLVSAKKSEVACQEVHFTARIASTYKNVDREWGIARSHEVVTDTHKYQLQLHVGKRYKRKLPDEPLVFFFSLWYCAYVESATGNWVRNYKLSFTSITDVLWRNDTTTRIKVVRGRTLTCRLIVQFTVTRAHEGPDG